MLYWVDLLAVPVGMCIGYALAHLVLRRQVLMMLKQLENRERLLTECTEREQKMLDGFMGKIGINTTFNEGKARTIDRSPKRVAELVRAERIRRSDSAWKTATADFLEVEGENNEE